MTNPEIIGYVCTISFAVAGLLALVPLYIFFRGKESSCVVWIAKFRKKHVPTLVEKIIVCAGLLLVVCTGKHVCLYRVGGVTISFAVVSILKHMI